MNLVILTGRLGADPETKTVGSSTVTKLRIATGKKWKNKDGEIQERTDWHHCEIWGNSGETVAKYFSKGDGITVRGEINYNENDGKWFTSIKVQEWEFPINKKGQSDNSGDSDTKENLPF